MSKEGVLNSQFSKRQAMLDSINDSIGQLQESAFLVIEQKNQGITEVSMKDYEDLLNWTLETLAICRDQI